jgi:hypothetical protein
MEVIAVPKPVSALHELSTLILPDQAAGDLIELSIRITSESLSSRDMAAFLELIDHVYGRSTVTDFRSYARCESGHLLFSRVRHGSLELVIERSLALANSSCPILILWLCLKYLPAAIHSLAISFNEYQQGLLARENRRRIRLEMDRDSTLGKLPKQRKIQLVRLIEAMYERERVILPRAARFTRNSVNAVSIRIRKSQNF